MPTMSALFHTKAVYVSGFYKNFGEFIIKPFSYGNAKSYVPKKKNYV